MEKEVVAAFITAGVSFLTAVGALSHSVINSKRQHKLAESVENSTRRLEALKIAKNDTEEAHEKLRDLLIKTQIVKQCIDIFLVEDHPSKLDAVEQVSDASEDLLYLYTGTLGQIPEEVRKWCHGLKNEAKEVAQIAAETWRLNPGAPLTKDLTDQFFRLRIRLDNYQRTIEASIRSLDAEVADRFLKYMVSSDQPKNDR